MNWTDAQKKVIDARHCNLLVSAAAGSGKTAVLVERIIRMICDKENPINIDELLVVTFTKAAAAQMRDKIEQALSGMLEKEPANEHIIRQLNYINQANILTIDSFCYQVVKEHFHLLGIDPGVRVGEAGELGLLREEVLSNVMESFYENNKDFVEFSDAFSADKKDDNIEEYILKVYTICSSYPRPSEWICQGKRNLHIESEEDFNRLTFVQKYFDEIHQTARGVRDKLQMALDLARDVDGPLYMEKALLSDVLLVEDLIAAKTYSRFYDLTQVKFANIGRGKKGEYDEEVADRIKKIRDEYKKQINNVLEAFSLPFTSVIQQFQKQEAMLCALLDVTECFRQEYLKEKLNHGILEFSDVEHLALQVLCKKYDEEGQPVPSDIGREMAENFREILIDEYQDSNYLQEAILQCVSRIYQGKNNIFMVGDVKQSIYSFRMARPDLFMEKYHSYETGEEGNCRKLLLKNNFRSRKNVLQTINYIFYQIMGEDLGGIEYTAEEELVPGNTFPDISEDSVELLLGESKDFTFLGNDEVEFAGKKEEILDENLEDIGKMELEASIVARRIQGLLGRDGSTPYQVTDKVTDQKTGEEHTVLRDVCLRDIVILFRAPASFQQIFSEVLMGYDIPVKIQNENGYFDTTEIQLLLSVLRVLDNPFNDVEVAAVLRSYFAGFRNEDLALLSLVKKYLDEWREKNKQADGDTRGYLYTVIGVLAQYPALKTKEENALEGVFSEEKEDGVTWVLENRLSEYSEKILDELCPKCTRFLEFVEEFQEKKIHQSVGQLLEDIYYHTGYYYYVKAMPEGKQRVRNLDLFYEEAKGFEKGAFQTLFDFLIYIDKILKKSISLGGDPAPENSDNVVRIMSIHKSKGLEFPVVFLSGTGKNFNLMDTKTPLIIHPDYYIGAKYVDTRNRCGNDTFGRRALASLMLTQSIAEELRIFYVGLTRAKEKLILTGVTPDMISLIRQYEEIAGRKEQKLSYAMVHTARNYLDLIVMSFIRNTTFHQGMQQVRKRLDEKSKEILSADYSLGVTMDEPSIHLQVQVFDFRSLLVHHIQSHAEKQVNRKSNLERLEAAPAVYMEQLKKRLSWTYSNEFLTSQKSKLSVTEIKRMYETDYEPSDVVEHSAMKRENYTPPVPQFIQGGQPMDGATKGTWVHKMMELLSNAEVTTKEQVKNALEEMWQRERLPEETKGFITVDKVYAFVSSDLGKRMCAADKQRNLFKEKQFVVGVLPQRLMGEDTDLKVAGNGHNYTAPIVVQGIVDAYFKEGDKLILVDYKTDRVWPGQEELLVKRYRTQMQYYKETLEQLTGLPVAESYLYSFALDKEITVL